MTNQFFALSVCLASVLLAVYVAGDAASSVSKPGGAGHALLFRDQIVVKKDFKNFPSTHFTFEAWISSTDFCHAGTVVSYAKDSKATDEAKRTADFNHFVIFDPRNLLACHDFQYIDLKPDEKNVSCHAHYTNTSGVETTAKYVERDGHWHHLAVTWSVDNAGLTKIYWDGLLMAQAYSHQTEPLVPDGALVLAGEQDCFGGCTDPEQGFYGMMDEVRIWKVVRSQDQIMRSMRWASGLENSDDLIAYWKFNDPDQDEGIFRRHAVAKDSSGKGNDLSLLNPPQRRDVTINKTLSTGKLEFKNNVALGKHVKSMPDKSFTVEFWARGQALDDSHPPNSQELNSQFFSYATQETDKDGNIKFTDDAIRVERYLGDYSDNMMDAGISTSGAISVHVNSNEMTDAETSESWIDFDCQWKDANWHHIAITWDQDSGETKLYFDGEPMTPFWRSDKGWLEDKDPSRGGVRNTINAKSMRSSEGALALGQNQNCFGGCFSPSNAFDGDLAVLRIWNVIRTQDDIKHNMMREVPDGDHGLVSLYVFDGASVKQERSDAPVYLMDKQSTANNLELRSNPPVFVYSDAPLTTSDGLAVAQPTPGAAGYSLLLSDQQVLMVPNFNDFPSDAITVEFWMWSVDTCRKGVPFSYAHGEYEKLDNAFLVFNYNSFGVSVMEDEGHLSDHQSGVAATDGNWHHIAVTWESSTGKTILYDNGRPVWQVKRAQGKKIPAGGTLVIGREQDCVGGCFDSASGAVGRTQTLDDQEYGAQDFFGVIEEMRVWKVVRTTAQIKEGMDADDGRGPGGFSKPGMDPDHPDLVAYWKFDDGQGYRVKDATGHGHDLLMAEKPRWQVVRWLSTCGNGAVEGAEECDDGAPKDGDGCDSHCKIEPGWECSGSPSVCTKTGEGPKPGPHPTPGPTPAPAPTPAPTPTPGPQPYDPRSDDVKTGGSGAGTAVAIIVTLSVIGAVGGFAYMYRHTIYDQFPQVEVAVNSVQAAVSRYIPGRRGQYHNLALDPEELDLSPEFLNPAPAPSVPPGHPGSYQPLYEPPAP